MRFSAVCLGVILLFACNKTQRYPSTLLIGHAGDGLDVVSNPFPDNSLDAINFVLNKGANGVEVDIQLSKDGEWILYHDEFLNSKTAITGCIFDYESAVLKNTHFQTFPNQTLATLNDLDVNSNYLFLDVRHAIPCSGNIHTLPEMITPLINYINVHPTTKIIISSSYFPLLDSLVKLDVNVAYGATNVSDMENVASTKNYANYIIRNSEIASKDIDEMHANGYKIIIFDVRSSKGNKTALKKGADFLMTDDVESAVVLKE